jgi:hypothetical protein
MPRYTLSGADRAGQWDVTSDNDLPTLANQLQWWQAQATASSRMYFVTDEERDGSPVPEEEIETALELWRDRRDERAAAEARGQADAEEMSGGAWTVGDVGRI